MSPKTTRKRNISTIKKEQTMNDGLYVVIKRILAVGVAVALWFLSLQFSVAGFSIEVVDMAWAGWILGFAVTVIELIFTSENRGRNLTLTFLGIGAYMYGVWSNIVGINASRGVDGFSVGFLFSVAIGLILEIAPEPLFLWGILGGDTAEGDIVGTISDIWTNARKRPVGRPRTNRFPFMTNFSTGSKIKPDERDTVSNKPDQFLAISRLAIVTSLTQGGRLVWDKNKSQSPMLYGNGKTAAVSRSLVRQMVSDKTLIEKANGMIIEYVLSGAEPPVIKPMFL